MEMKIQLFGVARELLCNGDGIIVSIDVWRPSI